MKAEDLILLAAIAAGVFFVMKKAKAAPADPSKQPQYTNTKLIQETNGWRYYTDGTVIGPDGQYYQQDAQVYDPLAQYRSAF